ncbi:MAG: cytochrome C oxidase subunit IV family protein [Leptospiraceae bacterium]|nr:cytochrome C oxidase subunit IV family protein [Leptospiraceae bacterium]
MSSSDSHAPHSHMKELTLTFAALIVLTIVTVKVAKIDFGSVAINITIAMFIASIKGLLVALYFMHLKWEEKLIVFFAALSIPFLVLMVSTMVWDVARKTAEKVYGG